MNRRAKVALALAVLVGLLAAAAVPAALWWRARLVHIPTEPRGLLSEAWGVRVLAFSPSGRHLVASTRGAPVRIYSVPDGALVGELGVRGEGTRSLSFMPDGDALVTCGENGEAILRRFPSGEAIRAFGGLVSGAAASPGGGRVALIVEDTLVVASVSSSGYSTKERVIGPGSSGVTFSPRGELVGTLTPGAGISWWRATDLEEQWGLFFPNMPCVTFAHSPRDGFYAVKVDGDTSVLLFATAEHHSGLSKSNAPFATIEIGDKVGRTLAFSPDGRWLICGVAGQVFSMETKERVSVARKKDSDPPFEALAISDEHAAGATRDGIVIWRLR